MLKVELFLGAKPPSRVAHRGGGEILQRERARRVWCEALFHLSSLGVREVKGRKEGKEQREEMGFEQERGGSSGNECE